MKLLLDENGNVVVRNGRPVYVHDDGKEIEFDAAGTAATIARLNKEAQTHREGKEAAESTAKTLGEQLKTFEGIDPEGVRKSLGRLKDIDDGRLIDSGKLDEVRGTVAKDYEGRLSAAAQTYQQKEDAHLASLAAMKADNEKLTGTLHNEVIGGSFARSNFIKEKLLLPADITQATFGKHFKMEDGKVVATDATGNRIFSRARPGELADFDEAIGTLVDQYPNRDHILRPSGASGSGASASAGSSNGGSKGIKRSQFDQMNPAEKSAHMRSGAGVSDD